MNKFISGIIAVSLSLPMVALAAGSNGATQPKAGAKNIGVDFAGKQKAGSANSKAIGVDFVGKKATKNNKTKKQCTKQRSKNSKLDRSRSTPRQ